MAVPSPTLQVAVAIVEWEGRFLVGLRPEKAVLAGYAEFPGGKCQAGEGGAAAAVRECREETGLAVEAVDFLEERTWSYPHATVELEFWRCRVVNPGEEPRLPFRWVDREELQALNFPRANATVLEQILKPPQ